MRELQVKVLTKTLRTDEKLFDTEKDEQLKLPAVNRTYVTAKQEQAPPRIEVPKLHIPVTNVTLDRPKVSRRITSAPSRPNETTYNAREAPKRPTKSAHEYRRSENVKNVGEDNAQQNPQRQVSRPEHEDNIPKPARRPSPPKDGKPTRQNSRARHNDQTIESVSGVLHQVIQENNKHLKARRRPPPLKIPDLDIVPFNEVETPRTPGAKDLYRFLYSFAYRTRMTHEPAVAMLAYIDRLIERTGLVLSSKNWKKILFTAVLCSQKCWEDESFYNSDYNKLYPELTIAEVNDLERSFLALIDFDLSISPELYSKYQKHLQLLYNNELDLMDASPYSPMSPSVMPIFSSPVSHPSRLVYSERASSPRRSDF
ncbi:hypothetical protein GEMRC1_007600 [Eukaryota sp. GEM-RC1]